MFHQKFVLEAVCALKFQGGLLNITTRDFTWNIYISKRKKTQINQTKIIVKHIRTEYIIIDNGGKNPVGSFKGNNENIPKITYELEFIFDKTFSSMLKVKLSIIEVDDKGMNNIELQKDIIKIKTDLSLNQHPIIIFESTVYPGVTNEYCIPILERSSDLKLNKDFYCGYSPERINPGDKLHNISSIVKITSGNNEEVSKWIDYLYGSVIEDGTFKTSNI